MGINHSDCYCICNNHLNKLQRTGQRGIGAETEKDLLVSCGQWLWCDIRASKWVHVLRACLAQLWRCRVLAGLWISSLSRRDIIQLNKRDCVRGSASLIFRNPSFHWQTQELQLLSIQGIKSGSGVCQQPLLDPCQLPSLVNATQGRLRTRAWLSARAGPALGGWL